MITFSGLETPTVTAISPSSGSTAGGTSVTITGTDFTGATGVTLGGTAATSVSVVNATTITCTTPAHAAGAVSVLVTTPGGSNTANTLYTYVAPFPDIAVAQASPLTDGVGTAPFGIVNVGSSSEPLTFTITNTGDASLTSLVVTKDGTDNADFTVSALSATSIPVGAGTATFTVTFSPGGTVSATRSAAIHIASNDPDAENPFDINLTGTVLSSNTDGDGDGLNDLAEGQLSALGFNWQVGQTALVNTYYSSANSAGLYTPAQVQALNVGAPLIQRHPTTGVFTLTFGVEKSATLLPGSFTPLPMTGPGTSTVINGQGKLEFQFTVPDNAAFFQLKAQ